MGIFLFSISRLKLGFVLDKEHIFSFRLIPLKKDHTKTSITPSHTLSLLFYGNYEVPVHCKISSWLALPQNCALTHTHLHNSIIHTLRFTFPQSSRPMVPCLATVRPLPKATPAVGRLPAEDTHRPRVTLRSARDGGGDIRP